MNAEKLYRLGKIKRGSHTSLSEKVEDKTNNKIVESYILSYSNVSSNLEDILLDNTIIEESNFEKVYIDLYGKFKNARVEAETILVPVNHNNKIPKFVNWKDKEKFRNLIFADDVIFIKPDKDYIDPKFLFYMMNTSEIINKLNEEKKLTCGKVESLQFKLPSMKEQLEIVKQLDLISSKKVELDKQAKKILEKLT